MSFENKNLYHLLGNDVEDEEPILAPREVVKKNTSTKKADESAKADPAKAKNNKKKASGNEGALKTKLDNKAVSAPASTASKHYKKPLDRHSRSTKKDSDKKVSQSWGSKDGEANLEDEVEAEEDAVAELEEDDETVVVDVPKRSLNDYFEELKLQQAALEGKKVVRAANEGNEDKWTAAEKLVKQQEEFVAASIEKKVKSKAHKEKKFLDIETTFADEVVEPSSDSSSRGRGAPRARGSSSRGRGDGAPRGRGAPRARGDGASRGRGAPRGARGDSAPRGRGAPRGTPRGDGKSSRINLDDDKKFPSL